MRHPNRTLDPESEKTRLERRLSGMARYSQMVFDHLELANRVTRVRFRGPRAAVTRAARHRAGLARVNSLPRRLSLIRASDGVRDSHFCPGPSNLWQRAGCATQRE